MLYNFVEYHNFFFFTPFNKKMRSSIVEQTTAILDLYRVWFHLPPSILFLGNIFLAF